MLRVLDVSDRDYARVLALQHELVERVAAGREPPTLLLCEHDAVVTVGRREAAARGRLDGGAPHELGGRPLVLVERGGGVTWHGPGQLVGYPIVPIDDHDLRGFLRRLERGIVDALARLGLPGAEGGREGATGVWFGSRKVASIGIAVRKWTAYHGFGLNVSCDLAAFRGLDPCGFPAEVMTSVERELGRPVEMGEARAAVAAAVPAALGSG